MTDIEKEMYQKVFENISNGTSKEFKAVASACYKIHIRELKKAHGVLLREDLNPEFLKTIDGINERLNKKKKL